MYNTQMECTYPSVECEETAYLMYHLQFLQIFGLDAYDDDAIDAALRDVQDQMVQVPGFLALLQHLAGQMLMDDIGIGMAMLYSYSYMPYTHACVREQLTSGSVSPESWQALRQAVLGENATTTEPAETSQNTQC